MDEQRDCMFWFYDPNDYEKYIDYLTLKAEKILFGNLWADGKRFFWGQFIEFVEANAAVQKLIASALFDAVKLTMQKGELDFTFPNPPAAGVKPFVPLYRVELDASFCKVFSADDSASILMEYIDFVERLHCKRLSKSRSPRYSMADYVNEVEGSDVLMDELTYAFDNGINRADIAASWTDERVEMVRMIYEICGY